MASASATGASPILYLPHGGGPLPLLGDPQHRGLVEFLSGVGARLGTPAAIVVISAHWEAPVATVSAAQKPALIYDYYGFPPQSYEIEYPAPGAPALAQRIHALLQAAGVASRLDSGRGFDHGLFVPLKLLYPHAQIPCLQVSLLENLEPAAHIALGRALAPLRDDNVLLIGSGMSFHNLRVFFSRAPGPDPRAAEFDAWLNETCADPGLSSAERERRLCDWESAPHARHCHPREEHLLPLHVCFGAAGADAPPAEVAFNQDLMGARVSALLW